MMSEEKKIDGVSHYGALMRPKNSECEFGRSVLIHSVSLISICGVGHRTFIIKCPCEWWEL